MKFKVILIVFVLSFICVCNSYSEVIYYENILSDAFKHSHKLLEAETDHEIKQAVVKETNYLRYPELSLKFYSEYEKDIAGDSDLTSIGGTVLSGKSQYQNSVYLDLNYKLLDYGISKHQVTIAKNDVYSALANVNKTKMDLEKSILELYSKILSVTIEIDRRNTIFDLLEELNTICRKIGKAGILDKLKIIDREIELEGARGQLLELDLNLETYLEDLSLYTGMVYNTESLKVKPLVLALNDFDEIDYKKLPEYKYYKYQYQMKHETVEIEKKNTLPSIDFYMRYSNYGADLDDYYKSFKDIRNKSFKSGISITIPLIENLKRHHTLSRLRLDMFKTKVIMDGKYEELRLLFKKLKKNYSYYQEDLKHKQQLLKFVKEKSEMVIRLTDNKLINLEQGIEQKVALINQELDLEKQIVERMSAIKHIMIQSEGAM